MSQGVYDNTKFNAALTRGDTEFQTKGCRHTSPVACRQNRLQEKCAFVRNDGMCLIPSRAWKKQFAKLLEEKEAKGNF